MAPSGSCFQFRIAAQSQHHAILKSQRLYIDGWPAPIARVTQCPSDFQAHPKAAAQYFQAKKLS